jgi:RNA polymerase sigma-70 factor (ECF subfamily)
MLFPEDPLAQPAGRDARFATTNWSLVLDAGATDSQVVRPAMGRLIERYWYPLYAFVRRKGHDAEDALDLTQEFLARLVGRNWLSTADPSKGRFRTFLLTALERFLVDEWRRESRAKRGGGRPVLSLSGAWPSSLSLSSGDAERRYLLEPADDLTPERIYERRWAMTILEEAMRRLEAESAAAGRETLFAAVRPVLGGEDAPGAYAEIAPRLGMKKGALRTAVHRLRRRFGAILRAEIAETVSDPREVDEELRHLFRSLRA